MKGINYITDEQSKKKAVVIDMSLLKKYDYKIEELFDLILAESRVDEPVVSWEIVKKKLRKQGKI